MVSKRSWLTNLVLLVVFSIDELSDCGCGLTLVDIEFDPHLESESFPSWETLIHHTDSAYLLLMREAMSDEILDQLLPNAIQEI